ncbi:MAG: class I SAM-dependent methyltransferase [Verrucomicrobia bacterium]|nr:class I SAM-dependent methyltransferase [Verrucomicrobiota bacterium]
MSLRTLLKYTALGRVVMIPYRFTRIALPYAFRQLGQMTRWSLASKEYYNHSYHLTELNQQYLASFTSVVSGHDLATTGRYICELETDEALRAALVECTRRNRDRHNCDEEPRYGRRLGWYALVRATKPRVVVETGVDRGLGTVVIAAALKRNAEEGCPGMVYATDIIPECGHLIAEPYKPYCRILLGDSVASLKQIKETVDIFLHDSDHRPEYEWSEFLAIEPRLHRGTLVLSDNSQQSPKLQEFSQRIGRSFLFFGDVPKDHWWPGDGIGVAFVPGVKTCFQPCASS